MEHVHMCNLYPTIKGVQSTYREMRCLLFPGEKPSLVWMTSCHGMGWAGQAFLAVGCCQRLENSFPTGSGCVFAPGQSLGTTWVQKNAWSKSYFLYFQPVSMISQHRNVENPAVVVGKAGAVHGAVRRPVLSELSNFADKPTKTTVWGSPTLSCSSWFFLFNLFLLKQTPPPPMLSALVLLF